MSGSLEKIIYTYSSDMNKAQEVNVDLKRLTEEQLREVLIQSRQELSRRYEERKRKAKQMVQCSGKNKRKEQCQRKADPSIGYCFYHLQDKQETPVLKIEDSDTEEHEGTNMVIYETMGSDIEDLIEYARNADDII